jgi:hypothetical protein
MTHNQLQSLASPDYEAIEKALMSTAKGRWFLGTYLQLNRSSETAAMLNAVSRLHGALTRGDNAVHPQRDLRLLLDAIAQTRRNCADLPDDAKLAAYVELAALLEAQLMAMTDVPLPEKEASPSNLIAFPSPACDADTEGRRQAKLFGELSVMVAAEVEASVYDS